MIARATGAPLVVGRSRLAAGRLLLERHPEIDIVVSDDGMQHWALARDLINTPSNDIDRKSVV